MRTLSSDFSPYISASILQLHFVRMITQLVAGLFTLFTPAILWSQSQAWWSWLIGSLALLLAIAHFVNVYRIWKSRP